MSESNGDLPPLRLFEIIRDWKSNEKEQARVLRSYTSLETPELVDWLDQWEELFARTEFAASRLAAQEEWLGGRTPPFAEPDQTNPAADLLSISLIQSREFVSQLEQFEASRAEEQDSAYSPLPSQTSTLIAQAANESLSYAEALEPYLAEIAGEDGANLRIYSDPDLSDSAFRQDGTPADALDATATGEGSWSRPPVPDQPPVPIGGHTLPPLPYPYNALEPHIDTKTMQLHHDIHHKSYVDGLNKAELEMQKARKTGDFALIKHWEREAAFNGAGHYLHTLFWNIMSPQGGGKPSGALAAEIDRDFGSFEAFKKHFSQAAEKVEGGGWAILVWSPRSHRLEILQAEKHQNLSQWDVIPLLALDVWEHAYYLKYQTERGKYVAAWWNVVNWPHVNERFTTARQVKWHPY